MVVIIQATSSYSNFLYCSPELNSPQRALLVSTALVCRILDEVQRSSVVDTRYSDSLERAQKRAQLCIPYEVKSTLASGTPKAFMTNQGSVLRAQGLDSRPVLTKTWRSCWSVSRPCSVSRARSTASTTRLGQCPHRSPILSGSLRPEALLKLHFRRLAQNPGLSGVLGFSSR